MTDQTAAPQVSKPDLTARSSFQHWVTHTIRYNDQDPVGHVNNAAMATFLEQGRTAFIYPLIREHGGPDLDIVLARITIDYLKELTFPGSVDIGTRVDRIGTKSLHLSHGVFLGGEETCVSTGLCALVFFDKKTRGSTTPPDALRAIIEGDMPA
ncbi:MAG: acyl-CoA thioesterase [Pseudomonadota bacterium]